MAMIAAVVMATPICARAQTPAQPSLAQPASPQLAQPAPPQLAPAQPPALAAPPVAQPAPAASQSNPGLIEELGNFWKRSTGILPSPGETFESLNAGTKSATESIGRLARPSSIANGRIVCQVAPNGAPDCKTAATKLCQIKGYAEGASLETDSAESCPAKVLMSGRPPEPGECRLDNYVTRALCQ